MSKLLTMSDAEYRKLDAVNYSSLKEGRKSIAHMAWAVSHPEPPKDSMRIGTALHAMLLEPTRAKELVAIAPTVNRRTNAGKDAEAAFYKANEGKCIIDEAEAETVRHMFRAVMSNPTARRLVKTDGLTETVATWTDEPTGLACKAKLDKYCAKNLLLDIKTTRDASPDSFQRDFHNLGYFMQAAWYSDGYERVDGNAAPYTILAIENEPPYGVVVYAPTSDAIAAGRMECRRILDEYAAALKAGAKESGLWPGYPTDTQPLPLPAWAAKRYPTSIEGVDPNW